MERIFWSYFFVCLVCSTLVLPVFSKPNQSLDSRKFVSKPNDYKKQQHILQQQQNVQQNSNVQKQEPGFWQNLLAIGIQILTTIFTPDPSIDKVDNGIQGSGDGQDSSFSWAQLISMGLRLLTMALGTDQGVDKVDSGNSAMQSMLTAVLTMVLGTEDPGEVQTMAKQAGEVIQVVVTLLEALKTSFSQRALQARSLNARDPVAFVSIATIDVAKGYVQTLTTDDESCKQKIICEANRECVQEVDDLGYLACRFGTYLTSILMEKTTYSPSELFTEAGKRGRQLQNCQELYLACNTV